MTNTTAPIEISKMITPDTAAQSSTVLFIHEKTCVGGGICETQADNSIYDAAIIYEF